MNKKITLSLAIVFSSLLVYAQDVPLVKGMKITKSMKVRKGVYSITSPLSDLSKGSIVIEGNNIVVDFNQAVLNGARAKQMPDEFTGTAVIVRGKNVTIKNLNARGYKVALYARDVNGLVIENCDFSYNYRPRLNSSQEKEDISDWMSYHHNEKDQWLRYGAAIYVRNCNNGKISNTKISNGQNALMMMESNGWQIWNNDFSFNSGIGLGMYKCSSNKVMYNRIIFNVRGYSHGVYNRGQDSAGILVYEQSNENLFYKNAVTHGGDGFFLWAGQYTMDTGKGGCNDNILKENDFSYAPTNGIEVTFSRNLIIKNRMYECDHGIWGGYSYESRIADNRFRDNRIAIAIEHGQENIISHNTFIKDKTAIKLWARAQQPSDWGYAKYRDTRSRNYILAANSFNDNPVVFDLQMTDSVAIFSNRYSDTAGIFKSYPNPVEVDTFDNDESLVMLSHDIQVDVPVVKSPKDPFKGGGKYAGRKNIMITEWGPYNFGYPLIWNTNPTDTSSLMKFNLLGPATGKWKIVSSKGFHGSIRKTGSFPDSITADKWEAGRVDIELVLEYRGPAFTDPFGKKIAANQPYRFSFRKFFQPVDFTVKWYFWDSTTNPVKDTSFIAALQRKSPNKIEQVKKLDYAWWGGIRVAYLPPWTQFLTVAEGKGTFEPGMYELGITWDDAVRVYVDDKPILDEWNPSKYTFDESPHRKIRMKLSGEHTIRVYHAELGGFATLSLKINRVN